MDPAAPVGNQRGSLVTVIVAMAVSLIILAALTTYISNLQKQVGGLLQKGTLVDLGSELRRILGDGGRCLLNFQGKTFDASAVPDSGAPLANPLLALTEVRDGTAASAPKLIAVSEPVYSAGSNMKVASIELVNWLKVGGDLYRADLRVQLSGLLMESAPVMIHGGRFRTDPASPDSAKEITSCAFDSLVKLECAVAGKSARSAGGTFQWWNHESAPVFDDIFQVHEFDASLPDSTWGLACRSPYTPAGCAGGELMSPSPSVEADLYLVAHSQAGCFSDNEEAAPSAYNPQVYLTCCKLSN